MVLVQKSRDELISDYLFLAERIARKHQRKGDFDDLHSEACLGVIHAIDKYLTDPSAYQSLEGFVHQWVKGSILSALKQNNSGAYIPSSTYHQAQQDVSFDELVESGKSKRRAREILNARALGHTSSIFIQNDGEENSIQIEDREESIPDFCMADVKSLLKTYTTAKERHAISMTYGIGCDPMKTGKIADKLKITIPCVAKLIESAKQKINRVRECKVCGETFAGTLTYRIYCSENCFRLGQRRARVYWNEHGRVKRSEEREDFVCHTKDRKKGGSGFIKIAHCKTCGREMQVKSRENWKFCSKKCRVKHKYPEKTCKQCGVNFHRKPLKVNGRDQSKFCTYGCSVEWKRANSNLGEGECLVCGKPFLKNKRTSTFCSKKCAMKYRMKDAKLGEGRCLFCDSLFEKDKITRSFCSRKCYLLFCSKKQKERFQDIDIT